jgi:hypothetical protein
MNMKSLCKQVAVIVILAMMGCAGLNQDNRSAPANSSRVDETKKTNTTTSRLCSLFTAAEIKDFLGAPVGDGKAAGPMDSACQWDGDSSDDQAVYAQVQLINDTQYWEKHSGAKGYEVLHGIGKEAFVASSLGGWEAGTVNDKAVVFVTVSGGSASRDIAVKFLRASLERLHMK